MLGGGCFGQWDFLSQDIEGGDAVVEEVSRMVILAGWDSALDQKDCLKESASKWGAFE